MRLDGKLKTAVDAPFGTALAGAARSESEDD